jgi:hypothetical protein
MNSYRFWKAGERAFDRLTTAALTLVVLRVGEFVAIPVGAILTLMVIAAIGDIVCGSIAQAYANEHNGGTDGNRKSRVRT